MYLLSKMLSYCFKASPFKPQIVGLRTTIKSSTIFPPFFSRFPWLLSKPKDGVIFENIILTSRESSHCLVLHSWCAISVHIRHPAHLHRGSPGRQDRIFLFLSPTPEYCAREPDQHSSRYTPQLSFPSNTSLSDSWQMEECPIRQAAH